MGEEIRGMVMWRDWAVKKGWLVTFSLLLFLSAGCAVRYNVPLVDVQSSPPPVIKKIPLKVGILIPDENYTVPKAWQQPGTPITCTLDVPVGQMLKRASLATFPYYFEGVEWVKGEPYPPHIEALVVPTVKDFDYAFVTVPGFPAKSRFDVRVSMKALMADLKGMSVWEKVISSEVKGEPYGVPSTKAFEEMMGRVVSQAMVAALTDAAKEITLSREVHLLASTKGKGEVETPGRPQQPSRPPVAGAGAAKDLPKIAVWDLAARETKAAYAQELTSILVSEIARMKMYEAYSQENIRTLAGWTEERMKLGCTSTQCLTALGQMDVAKLISGSVGKIGDTYSISLNLFDTQNARAENALSEFCRSENELISVLQQAVRKLLAGR
jgi:hypothetical protein